MLYFMANNGLLHISGQWHVLWIAIIITCDASMVNIVLACCVYRKYLLYSDCIVDDTKSVSLSHN